MTHTLPVATWQEPRFQWIRDCSRAGLPSMEDMLPLLDAGCGGGGCFLSALADAYDYDAKAEQLTLVTRSLEERKGAGVYGFGLEWDPLVSLRDSYPHACLLVQDVVERPHLFDPGKFQTILACEFFEHLTPYYASMVLGQLYAWLKVGGRIVITTPNAQPHYRPECVLSADHKMLWTYELWQTMLHPDARQCAWRESTGRAHRADFPQSDVRFDDEFLYVTIVKVPVP